MNDPTQARVRRFHLTPGRFVLLLLAAEVLLWLSERFGWLGWHKGYAVLTCVAVVGVAVLLMGVWFTVALVFRRRFQFSIRSLLVLVFVVALPCSWLGVKIEQQREVTAMREAGWLVNFEPEGPPWLRKVLGVELAGNVVYVGNICSATDADLERLKAFPHLRRVEAGSFDVRSACQRGGPITDAGLQHLRGLNELKDLSLAGTRITDAGLQQIRTRTTLEELGLSDTQVTSEGVAKLQKALPNCKITR
jgi:hypothetical protein